MPVIIGWSAVTGDIGWPAWVFFGVIFFWTPPHTWALAMRYREDYAAAGVPMLPWWPPERVVVRQIVIYSWAMVASSMLLVPAHPGSTPPSRCRSGCGSWRWRICCTRVSAARRQADDPVPPVQRVPERLSVAWAVDAAVGLPVLGWPSYL